MVLYTLSQKKHATVVFGIMGNVDRFSKDTVYTRQAGRVCRQYVDECTLLK